MKKEHERWKVSELVTKVSLIEFPEFQREPSVWKVEKKQRLIDSIIREFDISSIYFHQKKSGKYDCIDGQQRINAIWSFLGINDSDEDNKFHLKISNEIYSDGKRFVDADQKRYEFLDKKVRDKINNFELNIVLLSEIGIPEELNLQFLRLQLGAALNGGEKLNAMNGDMRDLVFEEANKWDYFKQISIRDRRFAREQVAAQIMINAFSKKETEEFHRSRYVDLQDFFKQKESFNTLDKKLVKDIRANLGTISRALGTKLKYINNRAMAVSVYLFAADLIEQRKESELKLFATFLVKFLKTLKWQVHLGLDMDREYRDLLNFQTNISQAAGEKTAIEKRHNFLKEYFNFFKKEKCIKGDKEFGKKGNSDKEREKIKLATVED